MRNIFIFVDNGSALTNFYQGEGTSDNNQVKVYGGFFTYDTQRLACKAIDPDTSLSTYSALLETNKYKPLYHNGRGISTTWVNSRAYSDVHADVGAAVGASQVQVAFTGALPTQNCPVGWDIFIPNRDRIQTNIGLGEWKIRVQLTCNSVIQAIQKKPLDF